MRQVLFLLVLVFSFSWVSASDGKRKEISTVEDVKEMRESQIERLTKRLSQEGLDEKKKDPQKLWSDFHELSSKKHMLC